MRIGRNIVQTSARLTLALLLGAASAPAFGQQSGRAVLNEYELGRFITASCSDEPKIAVQLLSAAGRGGAMLASLRDLGADVQFADEKVGYALVLLPKRKLMDTLDLPGVECASPIASDSWEYRFSPERSYVPPADRKPKPVATIALPVPRVGRSLPKDGPYFAAAEAGLLDLWRRHPRADGRGVRVAVVDEGLDLFHPGVRLAKDANDNIVPKVADIMTFSDPAKSPCWVPFGEPVALLKPSTQCRRGS
jgi:hypothetical protein